MGPECVGIFAETFAAYLREIRGVDYLARAEPLGLSIEGGALVIPLYDDVYLLSGTGVVARNGIEPSAAVNVMLCKYVLTHQGEAEVGRDRLVTYREFRDSGPLTSYFTTNTNKTIESTFSGNISELSRRALAIGGEIITSDSYDLSLEFYAFPRIPVILNFNDQDELFPAVCSVLYRSSAEQFLDMECLAMTGTLLTGKLIDS